MDWKKSQGGSQEGNPGQWQLGKRTAERSSDTVHLSADGKSLWRRREEGSEEGHERMPEAVWSTTDTLSTKGGVLSQTLNIRR